MVYRIGTSTLQSYNAGHEIDFSTNEQEHLSFNKIHKARNESNRRIIPTYIIIQKTATIKVVCSLLSNITNFSL